MIRTCGNTFEVELGLSYLIKLNAIPSPDTPLV